MDKFKHSCPSCGQRIEYTVEYCGHQIACPGCHVPIVFPAAPVLAPKEKLHLERDRLPQKKKAWHKAAFIQAILTFQHWKMVGACFVPFALVGGLLLGASMLRKASADQPAAMPRAVSDPVSSDAWKKMTELGQVDQAVQYRLRVATAAIQAVHQSAAKAQSLHIASHAAHDAATINMLVSEYQEADLVAAQCQQECNAAQIAFQQAFDAYQKLGGKVDYRSQLPH